MDEEIKIELNFSKSQYNSLMDALEVYKEEYGDDRTLEDYLYHIHYCTKYALSFQL